MTVTSDQRHGCTLARRTGYSGYVGPEIRTVVRGTAQPRTWPAHYGRVPPRCPRTTINSQRWPPAATCEHEANAGFAPMSIAREHARNASLGRARSVHDRAVSHGQPRSLADKSQHRPPGLMQVTVRAVSAFHAGHEGSIPFARSNQKPQVSALDLPGWQQTRVLVKAVDIANPGAQLVPAPRWRIVPRHRRRGAQHLA